MTDSTDNLYCSHDKLFKETWSNLDNARSFLENYLPHELIDKLNLSSLEICKDSFVEKNLREFYSDVLYRVRSEDGHAYIYCLFEHKSYPDSLIHLQLLKYMLGIWELGIKQRKSKKLDIIIPLVMYHGKANWNSPDDFSGLFNNQSNAFESFIPDFRYILFDLPKYSDEQIRGTIISRIVMLTFKHISKPDFEQKLPGILALLSELLTKETGLQYVESLLRYLLTNMENMTGEKLKRIVAGSITGKEGDIIMELADSALGKMFNKGIKQGMQTGLRQGLKETAFDLIDVKFGDTADTRSVKQLIKSIDNLDQLKTVKEKIKTITSISELQSFIGN